MALAKKCDVCGKYYDVPDMGQAHLYYEGYDKTNVIRIRKVIEGNRGQIHDWIEFDSCPECTQDIIDYILTRKADTTNG